jgi:hypothetical protein
VQPGEPDASLQGVLNRSEPVPLDIREFHNVVLTAGSVPLDILEQLVREYVAEKKA